MSTEQSMAAMRAKWAKVDAPSGDKNRESNFGNYYPFWNMKNGQRAVVRFLPDLDIETNERDFLVEQVFHNLTVNVDGKSRKTKVPCRTMYGEDCPVCKLSQAYYKAEGKESANGKKYWRKKQYIGQALIIEDPLPPNEETGETHAGKVRYLSLGFQIYNIIKEAFAEQDPDLALVNPPFMLKGGYDFIIKQSQQGEHNSYNVGTKFANKPRNLTEDELAVVSESMISLATLLPKDPGFDAIQAKLDADLSGEDYVDPRKASTNSAPKSTRVDDDEDVPVSKPVAAKATPAPAPVASSDDTSDDVDDMLAQIRARRQGK